ncbi:unnamed protein product [Symbiodinium microadriaticum]|nr:unnamed protein product [Symbiodinium microadriaticum]
MPLPYFGASAEREKLCERLPSGRADHALHVAVNLVVAALSWLHLGRPRRAPDEIRGSLSLDDEQLAHVGRLEEMLRAVVCHSPVSAEDMGRVVSKIENLEDIASELRTRTERVAFLCKGYGPTCSSARAADPVELDFVSEAHGDGAKSMTAKPVVASRLEFGKPPKFDPARFMDALSLDRYLNALDHAVPEELCPEPPPKARIMASQTEKLGLFKKLDESKRLRFLPASSTRKTCLNGLFAVPKSLTADRMILDARGPNLLEAGLNRWTQSLGCAEALLQLRLADNEILVLSGADLKVFSPEEMLTLKSRAPRSSIAGGVVIDDLFIAEKIDRSLARTLGDGSSAGAARLRRAESAYVEGGLVQNVKKSFSEQLYAEVWGAEIDGDAGTCRPLTTRLIPVLSVTVEVIRTKAAARYILASIAGFFVSIFQFRRRCMSLLEEVFKVPCWLGEHKAFRIWPALEAELWTLVVIAPVVRFNLRSGFCSEVSATDASDAWEAEVSQNFPEKFVEELGRHSLRKSVWTRLLRPAQSLARVRGELDPKDELPDGVMFDYHPVWQTLFRSVKFREVWRRRIWRPRHINVHELRTLLAAERRRGLAHPSSSIVTASDSQVSLGAVLKGRSASPRLNGILRQSLPEHLSSDVTGVYTYVGTTDNPADDPTRHAAVREAREAMPSWLEEALEGSYEGIESFLEEFGMDTVSLLELPPFESIVPLTSPDAQPPRSERRREFISSLGSVKKPSEAEEFAGGLLQRGPICAEDVRLLSELLPSEVDGTYSFSSGMFVHGGVVGLRRNCRDFPLSNAAVAKFVTETYPSQEFTSFALMTNVKTAPHRDSHNHQGSRNLVVKLSSFSGGEIWVSGDGGNVVEEIGGKEVPGHNLSFESGAVCLDPRQWHLTRDWSGTRVVLVLYCIRDFMKASHRDFTTLADAGFHLPSDVYKRFKFLSPPPLGDPQHAGEKLVAGNELRLEQQDLASGEFDSGQVFDLPHGVVCLLFEFDFEQFVFPKKCKRSRAEALQHPGYLDLYSGSRGVAHALAEASGTWVLTFDFARSSLEDLLDRRLQEKIVFLIRNRAFLGGGASGGRLEEPMLGVGLLRLWDSVEETMQRASPTERILQRASPPMDQSRRGCPSLLGSGSTLNACAKCVGARIGEAQNPGPPSKGGLRSLEDVTLVTAATAKLQNRVLAGFEAWLSEGLSDSARRSLSACAMAFCALLRAYGDFLFRSGSPMYIYRHLLAYMQKNRIELRPCLPVAWDLLTRWERVQPVTHRVPLPEAMFKAMFALGVLKGWYRWCAVLGLAYFGIARAGEPLRAHRKDLLLPSDTLSDLSVGAFMAVRSPKTAFRGKGKVQRICIKDVDFCIFLEHVLSRAPPEDLLYRGSPSSFRKRWDELLLMLAVPRSLRWKETVAAFFIACSLACAAFRKLYGEFLVLASRTLQPAGYAAAEKKTGVCPSRGNVSEESA